MTFSYMNIKISKRIKQEIPFFVLYLSISIFLAFYKENYGKIALIFYFVHLMGKIFYYNVLRKKSKMNDKVKKFL